MRLADLYGLGGSIALLAALPDVQYNGAKSDMEQVTMGRNITVGLLLGALLVVFAGVMSLMLGVEGGAIRDWINDVTGNVECSADVQFLVNPPDGDYQARIESDIEQLNTYWEATFPANFGAAYEAPCAIQEYDPPDFLYGDECGLDNASQAGYNAFYCGRLESIFWDGPTFFHPLYKDMGPATTTIILAHEFGHYIQDHSGTFPETGYNVEMQADCYAGAFLGWALETGYLQYNNIDEIIRAMAAFGQPRFSGLWTEVTYGNAIERNQALRLGAREGVAGCDIDFLTRFGNPRTGDPGGSRNRP